MGSLHIQYSELSLLLLLLLVFHLKRTGIWTKKELRETLRSGKLQVIEDLIVCGSFYKGSLCELA